MCTVVLERSSLHESLRYLKRSTSSSGDRPRLLGHALFRSLGENLLLRTTDGDRSNTIDQELLEISGDGEALVNLGDLLKGLRAFTDEHVKLCFGDGELSLEGSQTIRLQTVENDGSFEIDPFPEERGTLVMPLAPLKNAIKSIIRCTSQEESRFAVDGSRVETEGEDVIIVATDGHRLAVDRLVDCEYDPKDPLSLLVIPRLVLKDLEQICEPGEDLVSIRFDAHRGQVACGGTKIDFTRPEGSFPNWRRVLHPSQKQASEVELPDDLKEYLKVCARLKLYLVEFDFRSGGELYLRGRAKNDGPTCDREIDLGVNLEPAHFGMQPAYLLDAWRSIPSKEGRLTVGYSSEPYTPLKVRQPDSPYPWSIIMPMKLG